MIVEAEAAAVVESISFKTIPLEQKLHRGEPFKWFRHRVTVPADAADNRVPFRQEQIYDGLSPVGLVSPASLFDGAHAGLCGEPIEVLGNVEKFGVFLFAGPWTNTEQIPKIALVLFWAVIDGDDSVEVEAETFQFSQILNGHHFVEFKVAPIGATFRGPHEVKLFWIFEQGLNDTCRMVHTSRRPYAHVVFSEALFNEVEGVRTNHAAVWPRHEIGPFRRDRLAPVDQRLIKIKNHGQPITHSVKSSFISTGVLVSSS
jgi:hypothetical protein